MDRLDRGQHVANRPRADQQAFSTGPFRRVRSIGDTIPIHRRPPSTKNPGAVDFPEPGFGASSLGCAGILGGSVGRDHHPAAMVDQR
jgi:hypothetical protein